MASVENKPELRLPLQRQEGEPAIDFLTRLADRGAGRGVEIVLGGKELAICRESKYYIRETEIYGILIILRIGAPISEVTNPRLEADEMFLITPFHSQFTTKTKRNVPASSELGFDFLVSTKNPITKIHHRTYYIEPGANLDRVAELYAQAVEQAIQTGRVRVLPSFPHA